VISGAGKLPSFEASMRLFDAGNGGARAVFAGHDQRWYERAARRLSSLNAS
jgi:hypothetical protein